MSDTFDPTIIQGDTLRFQLALTDSNGITYDLTGSTLSIEVRKSYAPNGTLVFSASVYPTAGSTLYTPDGISGGISATATGGYVNVAVGSTYSKDFPPYTGVFYGVKVEKPASAGIVTLVRGRVEVLPAANDTE